jgi:4-amino-4-deoxy-L-arabinose transferase-like glycosyltransferase
MSGWRKAVAAGGAASALALLAWVYGTALAAPAVGLFHDDGVYAVTAKALATGRGYRIVSLPGEIPQTKYPILFPALLAAVWKVYPPFPENIFWLKLVPFACALAWGALGYRLLRVKTGSARAAMVFTALLAISPWVLFLGTALLSETLFAALTAGTLLVLGRIEQGRCGWREIASAGVLAAAAFLTRTAGVAGIAAGVVVVLLRAGWRRAMVFLMIALALCAPWIAWQMSQTRSASPTEAYYEVANYGQWDILFHFTLGQKVRILGENLLGAWTAPAALMGVPPTGWGAALAVLAGGLVAAGFWRRLSGRPRATEILTILYVGLILSWAWPPKRFLAPILPLLLLYGYEGAQFACRGIVRRARGAQAALVTVALLAAIPGVWTLAAMTSVARETGAVPEPNTAQDDWHEMARLVAWINRNTAGDAVLMGNLDPALYLYTGRKSVRGLRQDPYHLHYDPRGEWPLGSPADLQRAIGASHAGYLICTPNLAFRESGPLDQLTRELVRGCPDQFWLVYESRDARYRIYRITSGECASNLSDPLDFAKGRGRVGSNHTFTSVQTEEERKEANP